MILELALLKHILNYETYQKYSIHLEKEKTKETYREVYNIYTTLDEYFTRFNKNVSIDELEIWFYSQRPALKEKDKEVYHNLFDQVRNNHVDSSLIEEILLSMKQRQEAFKLSELAYEVSQGKKNYTTLIENISNLDHQEILETEDQFVTSDLGELYEHNSKQPGLKWRLSSLNKSIGSIRQGNLIIAFARVETGKTSFLASEVSFFAQQTQQPILWLNNEQAGEQVMLRIYQATLGVTLTELFSDLNKHKREYYDLTGDRIKLYDQGSIYRKEVERLVLQYQPACIIFDQIDKIKGFVSDREDLRLGAIYTWARELAKDYCPVIGVCQASGAGEGKKWLTMEDMSNSKTSKASEADVIIGIGKSHDDGMEFVRHFHLSKNKLGTDIDCIPEMRHGKFDTIIKPDICRYEDVT